jgi:transglutaminase-like putative cysteine protease
MYSTGLGAHPLRRNQQRPNRVTRFSHPARLAAGDAGTRKTLREMRQLVLSSLQEPYVRGLALQIVRQSKAHDYSGQALAIREYADDHFQFVRDPLGIEELRSPSDMAKLLSRKPFIQGDCDDAAILTAALGRSIGLKAKFTAIAFIDPRAPFTHVYTWLWTPEGWKDMDITRTETGATNFPAKRTMTQEV